MPHQKLIFITLLMFSNIHLYGQAFKVFVDAIPELKETIQNAKDSDKPILLLFNGIKCENPIKTSKLLNQSEKIRAAITSKYELLELPTNDPTPLKYEMSFNCERPKARTIGLRNAALEICYFGCNSQPRFFIIDADGNVLKSQGFFETEDEFLEFLQ